MKSQDDIMDNHNGTNKLTNWLLGALLTLILFIAGLYSSRLAAAEDQIRTVAEEQSWQRERIAVTEANYREITRRLDEMAEKLDRALRAQ